MSENRVGLRYETADILATFDPKCSAADILATFDPESRGVNVSDISFWGCSFESNCDDFKINNDVTLIINRHDRDNNDITIRLTGVIANKKVSKSKGNNSGKINRYGVKYTSFMALKALSGLQKFLCNPSIENTKNHSLRDSIFFKRQEVLAYKDLDYLENNINNLKNCQFQLLLWTLPIMSGLLASILSYFPFTSLSEMREFSNILLPTCTILSFTVLSIFLQKVDSIRKYEVFSLILQQGISNVSFPPNYRGWFDALNNFASALKKADKGGELYKEDYIYIPYAKSTKEIVSNAFSLMSILFLSSIPIIAFATSLWLGFIGEEYFELFLVMISICIVGGLVVGMQLKGLMSGKKTFPYLYALFYKILSKSAPYIPGSPY